MFFYDLRGEMTTSPCECVEDSGGEIVVNRNMRLFFSLHFFFFAGYPPKRQLGLSSVVVTDISARVYFLLSAAPRCLN